MDPLLLLSCIVFVPAAVALVLLIPGLVRDDDAVRWLTLAATAVVFVLTVRGAVQFDTTTEAARSMQQTFNLSWIPSFNINYFMGTDGISFPLLILTSFISLLAMGASWNITKHVKAYCVLFLLLETGMLGVFVSLDFFLFYVFWEVMLLPMYFLIGVWGGPRREYAALKFFLYTLVGSVLMLVAILVLYFNSDLRQIAEVANLHGGGANAQIDWDDLHISPREEAKLGLLKSGKPNGRINLQPLSGSASDAPVVRLIDVSEGSELKKTEAIFDEPSNTIFVMVHPDHGSSAEIVDAIEGNPFSAWKVRSSVAPGGAGESVLAEGPVHTFNLLALAAMGQHTDCFSRRVQWWCFLLLFIGFAIKVPSVPVHTWLPDAHVEAPTPISMILAGVLLKMGGYGIIRICYPICPFGGYDLVWFVCGIGVVSMVYGAFAAMAQKDFKRLVAYSSVSHMGYVVLGLGVWSAVAGTQFNPNYWNMGVKGAMFQMIAHGISSAGMFFMVGVIYDRVHHRNLDEYGGLFGKMPVYTALSIGIFFAGLGLPGLCGFIGEVLVVLSVWKFSMVLAVISAAVVIITAAYILWTIQRVYLGVEYKGPHEEELKPITGREFAVAVPLFVFAIVLGIFPHSIGRIPSVLAYMDGTVDRQVQELADWTDRNWSQLADQTTSLADQDRRGDDVAQNDDRQLDEALNFLVTNTAPGSDSEMRDELQTTTESAKEP